MFVRGSALLCTMDMDWRQLRWMCEKSAWITIAVGISTWFHAILRFAALSLASLLFAKGARMFTSTWMRYELGRFR